MLFNLFIISMLVIALLLMLEAERQRRAKHRLAVRSQLLRVIITPHIQTTALASATANGR